MPSLRKATLLSLLASIPSIRAQATTSTWGEPFSVDSPSTQNLLPTSVLVSSAASVASSQAATLETGSPSRSSAGSEVSSGSSAVAATSVVIQSSSPVSSLAVTLPSTTMGGLVVSTPLSSFLSSVSETVNSETGTTSTSAGASITTGTVGAQSTGAAPTPYVRMGVMGVIAGAAGVLMV